MDLEKIIDLIAEEVVRRMRNRPKKALVIFTGAAIGFSQSIKCIKNLKEDGWDLKILLSKSAEYVLTRDLIKESLDIDKIHVESEVTGMKELYNDVDMIIIPALTLNSAVKIALCICDNLVTNIVSHGIMEGIPILAAKDACDLRNPVRSKLGAKKIPEAYLNKVEDYISILESYGIKMVEAKDIYKYAIQNRTEHSLIKKPDNGNCGLNISKRVLSRADIIGALNYGRKINISKSTIITALAKETAKEYAVEIVRNR